MRGGGENRGRLIMAVGAVLAMTVARAGLARPAGAAEGDTLDVAVKALGPYGVRGSALITEVSDGVSVEIDLDGIGVTGAHPAHLHLGTCDGFDPLPLYPLADVDAAGVSVTTVPGVTIADLLAEPFVVNVHESAENITTVVACGNLKAAGETGAASVAPDAAGGTGGAATDTTYVPPTAGVGAAFGGDAGSDTVLIVLGGLAALLAGAGLTLRWREGRG